MRNLTHVLVATTALLVSTACTMHDTQVPTVAGPSELAQSLKVTATPDSIPQDGASQSVIVVQAFNPAGQPLSNLSVKLALSGTGGSLSSVYLLTASDGKATTVFTAPGGSTGLVGTTLVGATPVGTDASAASTFEAKITLTPTAAAPPVVIVPNSPAPTADFTSSPSKPVIAQNVFFNGSPSAAAVGHFIAQYRWDFGDGAVDTTSGVNAAHPFALAGTYNVSLTVTDNVGAKATKVNQVTIDQGLPTVVLLLTKTGGVHIQADASGSFAAGTSKIATYTFIWGDGNQTVSATPVVAYNNYPVVVAPATETFTVTVRVTDDAGRTGTGSQTITVP